MHLTDKIYNKLYDLPLVDIHTHIDAAHLSARGLHDILLYHMVNSELYSSGCPQGNRLSEEPSEEEKRNRIEKALPYINNIRNTSCFWGVSIILRELYGWNEKILPENWTKLDSIIKERSADKSWAREILKKAGIKRSSTESWRRRDGSADDIFDYCLEWAYFTRTQWKRFDASLIELENAWSQNGPGETLSVNIDTKTLKEVKKINSLDDVHDAIDHYCKCTPFDKIYGTAQHISTDITYRIVSDDEMAAALKNRDTADVLERDIYANYIMEEYLKKLNKLKQNFLFQFSCGAEPLPLETGSKMHSDTLFQLADIFRRYPNIKFQAFLASNWQNQTLCTLVRELPNLSVAGYWWHNFFPGHIQKIIYERLDMLPMNKQAGFFSDAYCTDWSYAKAIIVKKQMAYVLAEKITQGQYSMGDALDYAKQIFYDTPMQFMKVNSK